MNSNVLDYTQDLYFGASVAMKVQDSLRDIYIFLFDEESTDIFALIIGDSEVYALDVVAVNGFLFGEYGVDVIGILSGGNDATPCSLEVYSQTFH